MGFQDYYSHYYDPTVTAPITTQGTIPCIYIDDSLDSLAARVAKLEQEIAAIKEYLKGDDGR